MAEQFGIRLAVSLADLAASINKAIKRINSGNSLDKIKIGADTSELETAIKRIKSELASITGRNSTPKIELGTSRADGQITLDELTAFRKAEEALANPVGMAAVQAELNKTVEIVKSLTSAISTFKTEYSAIGGANSTANSGGLIDPNAISERIKTAISGINITKPVEIPIAFKGVQEAVAALQQQVNGTVINIGTSAVNGKSTGAGETVSNAVKRAAEQATEALKQQAQAERELENAIKSLNGISNNTVLYKNKGVEEIKVLLSSVEQLKDSYQTLMNNLKSDSSPENLARIREQMTGLKEKTAEMTAESDRLIGSLGRLKIDDNNLKKVNQLIAQMEEYMRRNSSAMGKPNSATGITYGDEIRSFISQLQAAGTIGDSELSKIANGFANIKYQIKAANLEGNTFFRKMKEKATKFIKWTAMTLVITKARMYFNKLFTTVYELDTELIDLKKTFKGSAEELNDFYFEANKLAKQMGVTTAEIIKQGSAWSRLGFSSNETMKKMTEMSSMFAAISPDMDTEQAQNGLVSIMKAFDIDPNDVLDGILSKVNIIGNTAATSNGEIVEMLQRSSSAMKEANNTLEETIALETAAVEITRDSASVGTAYKTISARLRGLDEETLEVIEDTEILTGKFAEATKTINNPGGLSLFTDSSKQTFKSTYQIIKELSTIWDDLSDVQQAKIEDIVGGKRQLQIVAASISNFKAAEKALDDMANSAGNAEAEMEIVRESAAYAFNEFKETFTELAQSTITRDFLKNLINSGTKLLETISDAAPVLNTLLSLIGGVTKAATGLVNTIGLLPSILAGLSLKNIGESYHKHAYPCIAA